MNRLRLTMVITWGLAFPPELYCCTNTNGSRNDEYIQPTNQIRLDFVHSKLEGRGRGWKQESDQEIGKQREKGQKLPYSGRKFQKHSQEKASKNTLKIPKKDSPIRH